jgi:hypothetical protein
MVKSRIIMTGATGKKGSIVVAEPLRAPSLSSRSSREDHSLCLMLLE